MEAFAIVVQHTAQRACAARSHRHAATDDEAVRVTSLELDIGAGSKCGCRIIYSVGRSDHASNPCPDEPSFSHSPAHLYSYA